MLRHFQFSSALEQTPYLGVLSMSVPPLLTLAGRWGIQVQFRLVCSYVRHRERIEFYLVSGLRVRFLVGFKV